LSIICVAIALGLSLLAQYYQFRDIEVHEFVNAVRELGIFWAVINEPPPGSVKKAL
jgi:hypothetical protein